MILIVAFLLIISFLIFIYSRNNGVRRNEWVGICFIISILLFILAAGLFHFLIYPAIFVCFSLFGVSFLFDRRKFIEHKHFLLERTEESNRICLSGEFVPGKKTHRSMVFYSQYQEIGLAFSQRRYEFSFLGATGDRYDFVNTDSNCFFPFRWIKKYELISDKNVLMRINYLDLNKINVEMTNFCLFSVKLNKRKLIFRDDSNSCVSMFFYDKGVLIDCNKNNSDLYVCLSYFLWMVLYGRIAYDD